MERHVELGRSVGVLDHLDRARQRVASDDDATDAADVGGLREKDASGVASRLQLRDAQAAGDEHLRPGRDVQPGLDDGVVTDRDAEARVGAEQRMLSDGDLVSPAAGERSHDGGAAADVAPVADGHTLGDAALDHGGAEGAGVEVDEALVHDGRSRCQVGAESDPRPVRDADAGRDDVVEHGRELVHRLDRERRLVVEGRDAVAFGGIRQHRPGARPGHVREEPEDAVEVDAVGRDLAVRQQVQSQPGVLGARRRLRQVLDPDQHHPGVRERLRRGVHQCLDGRDVRVVGAVGAEGVEDVQDELLQRDGRDRLVAVEAVVQDRRRAVVLAVVHRREADIENAAVAGASDESECEGVGRTRVVAALGDGAHFLLEGVNRLDGHDDLSVRSLNRQGANLGENSNMFTAHSMGMLESSLR